MRATKSGDFKPHPQPNPSTTFARCYSVVDFGTAEQFFKGESNGKQRRIYVGFELPEFTHVFNEEKGPQPYVVGKEMKLSTHENSSLADFVKGFRGTPFTQQEQDGFDPMVFLGKTCILTFNVKVKQAYANQQITAFDTQNSYLELVTLAPMMQGVPEQPPVNPQLAFDFDLMMESGQFDMQAFMALPKWQREKIEKSDEFLHFQSLGQVVTGQEGDFGTQPAQPAQNQGYQNQPNPTYTPQAQPAQPAQPAQQPPQANPGNPPAGAGAPQGW